MVRALEEIAKTFNGSLATIIQQADPSTVQHSDEITNGRRTADEPLRTVLRAKTFYTGDFLLYTVEDGQEILYIGRAPQSPILKHMEEAAKQLRETGNYIPSREDISAVIDAVKTGETLRVRLSDLELRDLEFRPLPGQISYFIIDTAKYNALNPAQRIVAERFHGSMGIEPGQERSEFELNMKMFRENGINAAVIYILRPEYVRSRGPIVRATVLYSLDCFSSVWAVVGNTDMSCGLRGEPRQPHYSIR